MDSQAGNDSALSEHRMVRNFAKLLSISEKSYIMRNRSTLFLLYLAAFMLPEMSYAQSSVPNKARLIYPDAPGASQTCVVPVDPDTNRFKLELLSELKLIGTSSEGQCKLFVVSKRRISIIGRPDLCVNIAAGAGRGILYLEACRDVSVTGWDIKATAAESSRLRSLGGPYDNMCWAIPNLGNENAKFPLRVQPAPCQKNVDNELKFFVE